MLKSGDKIALISPSGWIERQSLEKGIAWLNEQGLIIEIMPHAYDSYRYMAGSDEARADDVNLAFAREDIKAIFCTRGGAGATKILDLIDYETIKKNPKPIFGLSDSTALQNAVFAQTGNVSYTGFLPIFDFKNGILDEKIADSLQKVFSDNSYEAVGGKTMRSGTATGVMVGGCLSVLCYLCGTKYFPNLENKILLLEDVGEKTYRLEMMLNQLKMQAGFSQLKGVVWGEFVKCWEADVGDGSVEDILTDFSRELNVPIITDFPYGHGESRYVLPIGREVILDADNKKVTVILSHQ